MNWKHFFSSPWFGAGVIVVVAAVAQLLLVRMHAERLVQFQGNYLHRNMKALLEERFARAQGQVQMLSKQKDFLLLMGSGDYASILDQAKEKQELLNVDLIALGTKADGNVAAQSPEPKSKSESALWAKTPCLSSLAKGLPYSGIHMQDGRVYQISAFPVQDAFVIVGQALAPSLLAHFREITGGEMFLIQNERVVAASADNLPKAELERDLKTYFKFDALAAQKTDTPTAVIPYTMDGKPFYAQFGVLPTANAEDHVLYGLLIPSGEATARLDQLALWTGIVGWTGGILLILVALVTSRKEKLVTQTVFVTQDGRPLTPQIHR